MGDVLNMPCRKGIHQDEEGKPVMKEVGDARREFAHRRDKLLAAMDEPLRVQVEDLLKVRDELASLEKQDAYVRGTRMGAKMAAALLRE